MQPSPILLFFIIAIKWGEHNLSHGKKRIKRRFTKGKNKAAAHFWREKFTKSAHFKYGWGGFTRIYQNGGCKI